MVQGSTSVIKTSYISCLIYFITGQTAPADVAQETSVSQPNYKKSYAYMFIHHNDALLSI